MVDLAEIEATGDTTFETCEHLAHLKITRDLLRDRLNVNEFDVNRGNQM